MEELLRKVLSRIKPSKEENRKLKELQEKYMELLENLKNRFSYKEILPVGSFSRDTHLKGSSDIDIFLLYDKNVSFEKIEEEIRELAKIVGGELNYAQHPYIRKGDVEIVPAYKISPGEKPLSATDRTPLHNEYVKRKLSKAQKDEVRLLKAFMKGIGVYGAEIKVEGFSGYVCELLVIKYGSFLNVLKNAAQWKKGEYIDIEGNGNVREKRPLIIVDPVDPQRNAAHTVSEKSLSIFIIAAREFIRNPSEQFFFPKELKLTPSEVRDILLERNSRLVAVEVYVKGPSDNIWAQLKRLGRLLSFKLKEKDNFIIQWDVFYNEKDRGVLVLEIGGRYTAHIHKRVGPPVYAEEHSDKFMEKHRNDKFGPFVEGERLISFYLKEEKSLLVEVVESLMEIVEGKSVGGELYEALKGGYKIFEGVEVLKLMKDPQFSSFISHFLIRKFRWQI